MFLHYLMSYSAVVRSLAPMTIEHPLAIRYLTVYAPTPELPPVTTAVLPLRLALEPLNTPPLKYLLVTTNNKRAEPAIRTL